MGRAELFPRDRALVAQMVLVSIAAPLLVLGGLGAALALLPQDYELPLILCLVVGLGKLAYDWRRSVGTSTAAAASPDLVALVARLCAVADISPPAVRIEWERQPNSWLVDVPGRPPRLHLTTGLLGLLDHDELAAVIAHELSHLVNRDALVMTSVGLPGLVLLKGGWGQGAIVAVPLGFLSAILTGALSRCRELAADRGACAITGRPSALASALIKVSDGVATMPGADLRKVALRDSFHLVATGAKTPCGRLSRTHPSLQRRLAALERLEHDLHHARRALD